MSRKRETSTAVAEKKPPTPYPTGGWVPELTDWRVAVPVSRCETESCSGALHCLARRPRRPRTLTPSPRDPRISPNFIRLLPQNSVVAIAVGTVVSIWMVNQVEPAPGDRAFAAHAEYYHPAVAAGVLAYYVLLCASRWLESDSHVLYEMLWGCNIAMLLSVIAMLTNSPLLAGIGGALVTIDQMFWYIDCLGFLVLGCRKFPVGVAAYLQWPETALMKRLTAFHHLWFLPLLLWTLGWRFPDYSFPLSVAMSAVLAVLGRFLTPFHCLLPKARGAPAGEPHKVLYLNINFGYTFWKDVKVGFLHAMDHRHPLAYIPYVVVVANAALNFPAYCVLNGLLALVAPKA